MSDSTAKDGPEAAAPLPAPLGAQGAAVIEEAMEDAGVSAALLDARNAVVWLREAWNGQACEAGEWLALSSQKASARERERRELLDLARRIGQPVQVQGMVRGRWTRTVFRPLREAESGESAVLLTCRPICEYCPGQTHEGAAVTLRSRVDDLGELARLSERELQILRLIGVGLSTREMAAQLHRSEKTIEAHRLRLGQKLGGQTRVHLARTAIRSGLTMLDEQEVELIHRQRMVEPERGAEVDGDE